MKILSIILITLSSLFLLGIYPLMLMANLMALAALPASHPEPGTTSGIHAYLWASTLYPLPYLTCLVASIWNLRKGSPKKALIWQGSLVGYLLLIVGLLLTA